jgi:hypothetical protein
MEAYTQGMAAPPSEPHPGELTGVERALEVRLGSLGGFELRPTRLFVWRGEDRDDRERIIPFGGEPVGLEYPRRESTVRAGEVELRTVGNPLMTIALAGVIAFRRWADAPDDPAAQR